MPLTVLTDYDVRTLLLSLSRADVLDLQHNLAEALHQYSTGTNDNGCCSVHQPQRISISKNGQTTLFMPATTGTSTGMKVITLADPTPTPTSSASSALSDNTITPSPSVASSPSTTPRGSLTLLDSAGSPIGLINAEELTAFRTALAASIILSRRTHVHTLTVFGAGKQAFWHIRLALLLRGHDIKHVNIINRSFVRARNLMQAFYSDADHERLRSDAKFSILSSDFGEYPRLLKESVRKADVILCCTPATEPLFPPEYLTATEGRRKGRYVSAIGSYTPQMCELHPDVLRQAVASTQHAHHHHHHKHAASEGVVVVDSLTACLKEAGEIIQAGLTPEQLVEVGELLMVKKAALKEMEMGGEGEKGLREWIEKGNVIYKSVGLGLMDVCVGEDVCRLARERGIGTVIDGF